MCKHSMSMGLGKLGDFTTTSHHKHRWTFEAHCPLADIPSSFVKMKRPEIKTELQAVMNNDPRNIIVTFNDVQTDIMKTWAELYRFLGEESLYSSTSIMALGKGTSTLWNGCGEKLEEWTFDGLRLRAINFGELDYSNSESCTIEAYFGYQKVSFNGKSLWNKAMLPFNFTPAEQP